MATSWALDCIIKLEGYDDRRIRTDVCQFGMTSRIGGVGSEEGPVLKPPGFLTNSPRVARELSRRCPRTRAHVPLVGGRAAAAAIYPHRLCCAICKGIAAEIRERRLGRTTTTPMLAKDLNDVGNAPLC